MKNWQTQVSTLSVLGFLVVKKVPLKVLLSCLVDKKEAYELVADVLEEISAKAPEDGKPCVTYIGPDGAGHYVKMVHNGIEYGDMQLIAESYDLMQHLLGLSAEDMAEIFTEWNKGELDSYLIEITADILGRKDDEGQDGPIVDYILDAAGNLVATVTDVQKAPNGQALHTVEVLAPLALNQEYTLAIDTNRRHRVMKNHTATHLLHAALHNILGNHATQAGSLNEVEFLRFDLRISKQ